MSRQFDVDRNLETWLTDGPTRMPEHMVSSIVTQLEETHQRKHLWLPGREQMNRMMVAVAGTAAIGLLAVVGLYFVGHGRGIGNQATPTDTPSPTALGYGTVAPGRHFIDVQGYRYTFDVVGLGWRSEIRNPDVLVSKGSVGFADLAEFDMAGTIDFTHMVWIQPCQWTGSSVTPGPGVDDLATALAGLHGFTATQPTDMTVGGYSGKRLQLTVPGDVVVTACTLGEYRSWDGRNYQAPGQTDDVQILDIDGTRTMIYTTSIPGVAPETLVEMSHMFDSLEIAPTPTAAR